MTATSVSKSDSMSSHRANQCRCHVREAKVQQATTQVLAALDAAVTWSCSTPVRHTDLIRFCEMYHCRGKQLSNFPLSPSITLSLFHSKLKTYLFGKSFPPKISLPQNLGLTSSANGTVFCFYCLCRCSHVFGAVDKTSSSFSAHGKIGNFIIIIKSN